MAAADFFNAPSVDEMDVSGYGGAVGDQLVIRASDDFDVMRVSVAITDAAGNTLESGQAVETPARSGRWVYTATVTAPAGSTVRIAVTAVDRPGGAGAAQVEKALPGQSGPV